MSILEKKNFSETPKIISASESHMALVFLLDTSGSMHGKPIDELNKGLNRFKDEVCNNKRTREILDVAIIEFNSTYRVVQDFVPIMCMPTVNLVATGNTVMTPAIREAMKMVEERMRFYRAVSERPYKPWIILISDGAGEDITEVANEIKLMEESGKLSFRSLGVGKYDSKILHQLSGPKVMKLEGLDFTDFFNWVSKSMRSVSLSSPGEKPNAVNLEGNVKVDIERDTNWD